MRYRGLLYRALNPAYSRAPLSGAGAERFGGRFNRIGRPALYLALAPETALREANQVGALQPTALVAYRADVTPLFDARDIRSLASRGISASELATPAWRDRMIKGLPVPTQDFAEALVADGFAGMIVRSFTRGASPDAANMVLWSWENMLEVIDDDDRLGRLLR